MSLSPRPSTWLRGTNDLLHIQQSITATAACSFSSRRFILPTFSALTVLTAGSHLSVVSAWGAFPPALHFPHTQKCRGRGLSWLVLLSRHVWNYSFTFMASKKDTIYQNSFEGRQYLTRMYQDFTKQLMFSLVMNLYWHDLSHVLHPGCSRSWRGKFFNAVQHFGAIINFCKWQHWLCIFLPVSVHRLKCVCVTEERGALQGVQWVFRNQ